MLGLNGSKHFDARWEMTAIIPGHAASDVSGVCHHNHPFPQMPSAILGFAALPRTPKGDRRGGLGHILKAGAQPRKRFLGKNPSPFQWGLPAPLPASAPAARIQAAGTRTSSGLTGRPASAAHGDPQSCLPAAWSPAASAAGRGWVSPSHVPAEPPGFPPKASEICRKAPC